jgi:hypothetical protein
MNNTLQVFSAITTHLVSLTGTNDYDKPKSKGIATYADLATELNQQGIRSSRNTCWTESSLKNFLSRCRKNYPKSELMELCPLELIGAEHHEFLAHSKQLQSGKIIRFKRSLYQKNISTQ